MILIKLLAFFLLFKNSEACARSSLDNIFITLITLPLRLYHYTTPATMIYSQTTIDNQHRLLTTRYAAVA
jgi:hypothetical protein